MARLRSEREVPPRQVGDVGMVFPFPEPFPFVSKALHSATGSVRHEAHHGGEEEVCHVGDQDDGQAG